MIGVDDVRAAAERLSGQIRYTPVVAGSYLKAPLTEASLTLKLELLQVTGSFKARGAMNRLLATPGTELAKGIVAASGGNHGLAVARAGAFAGVPTTIFLPTNASPAKVEKLRQWGAETVIIGDVWDATHVEALAFAAKHGTANFHPFADPLSLPARARLAWRSSTRIPRWRWSSWQSAAAASLAASLPP